MRCDHSNDAEVELLFDRIRQEHGRLDLLVNNVWGGYEDSQCRPLPLVPFWEQSLSQWDRMFVSGVRAHLVASQLAVPLMLPQHRGLIVSTTANLEALPYMRNVFYDLAKNAISRLTWAIAQELRESRIAALAVAPGFMRTERVVEAFRRAGAEEALKGPGGPKETTAYLGRAIVALASDARILEKSGQLVEVGTLARRATASPMSTGRSHRRSASARLSRRRWAYAGFMSSCAGVHRQDHRPGDATQGDWMRRALLTALILSGISCVAVESQRLKPEDFLPEMNQPVAPVQIIGNIYYVGTNGVSSFLIVTPAGHILLDSGFNQSVPLIRDSVTKLGFRFEDIRILLSSHAHFDHVAGHALVQQLTGAQIIASQKDGEVIARGDEALWEGWQGSRVHRLVADDDVVSLGGVELRAHLTRATRKAVQPGRWKRQLAMIATGWFSPVATGSILE